MKVIKLKQSDVENIVKNIIKENYDDFQDGDVEVAEPEQEVDIDALVSQTAKDVKDDPNGITLAMIKTSDSYKIVSVDKEGKKKVVASTKI